MVNIPSYLAGFTHPSWCRISCINRFLTIKKTHFFQPRPGDILGACTTTWQHLKSVQDSTKCFSWTTFIWMSAKCLSTVSLDGRVWTCRGVWGVFGSSKWPLFEGSGFLGWEIGPKKNLKWQFTVLAMEHLNLWHSKEGSTYLRFRVYSKVGSEDYLRIFIFSFQCDRCREPWNDWTPGGNKGPNPPRGVRVRWLSTGRW